MKVLKVFLGGVVLTSAVAIPVHASNNESIGNEDVSIVSPMLQVGEMELIENLFPDDAFAEFIARRLGVSTQTAVTNEELNTIRDLKLAYADGVQDLTGISNLTELRVLDLNGTEIVSLEEVGTLWNLEVLYLVQNISIKDYSAVGKIKSLNTLDIYSSTLISLPYFEHTGNIVSLTINVPFSRNYEEVGRLQQLKYLSITGGYGENLETLDFLRNLTELETLSIVDSGISDVRALSELANLKALALIGGDVQDITPLSTLSNLQNLNLTDNAIGNVSALSNLAELQLVSIELNKISDITPLRHVPNINARSQHFHIFSTGDATVANRVVVNPIRDMDGLQITPTRMDSEITYNDEYGMFYLDVFEGAGYRYLDFEDRSSSQVHFSGTVSIGSEAPPSIGGGPAPIVPPVVEETTSPVEESTAPVEETTTPVEETTTPVEETTAPVEETTTPVEETTTPVEETTTSVEETTAPVEETTTPVEETTTPVEETTTPVEETTAPVEETTTPVEETTTPVEETTTPVEETTTPVEETTTQVEETTTQVEETTTQVEEGTTQVEETTTPVEESTKPVEESTTQVEETTKPVEETTKPVEESTTQVEKPAVIEQGIISVVTDPVVAKAVADVLGLSIDEDVTAEQLASIKTIEIAKGAKEITGLDILTGLEELTLKETEVSDITVLAKMKKLDTLEFTANEKITDYSTVNKVNGLASLTVTSESLKVLPKLNKAESLKTLLLDTPNIKDFSTIKEVKSLTVLSIKDAGENLSDISFVKGLTQLQTVGFAGNDIKDISVVSSLTDLQVFVATSNNIEDVSALAKLSNLTFVDVSGNRISEMSALANVETVQATNQLILFEGEIPGTEIAIDNTITGLDGALVTPTAISHGGRYEDGKLYFTGVTENDQLSFTFNQGDAAALPLPDTTDENGIVSALGAKAIANKTYSYSGTVMYYLVKNIIVTPEIPVELGVMMEGNLVTTGENQSENIVLGMGLLALGTTLIAIRKRKEQA